MITFQEYFNLKENVDDLLKDNPLTPEIGNLTNNMKNFWDKYRVTNQDERSAAYKNDFVPLQSKKKELVAQHIASLPPRELDRLAKDALQFYKVDEVIETLAVKEKTERELLQAMPNAYGREAPGEDDWPEPDRDQEFGVMKVWQNLSDEAKRDILTAYYAEN